MKIMMLSDGSNDKFLKKKNSYLSVVPLSPRTEADKARTSSFHDVIVLISASAAL